MSIETYKATVEALLSRHYGLELGDTPFCQVSEIQLLIDGNVEPFEALNSYAEDCGFERTDLSDGYGVPSKRPLTGKDQDAVVELTESCSLSM